MSTEPIKPDKCHSHLLYVDNPFVNKLRHMEFDQPRKKNVLLETLENDYDNQIMSGFKEMTDKIDVPRDPMEIEVDRKISQIMSMVQKKSKPKENLRLNWHELAYFCKGGAKS